MPSRIRDSVWDDSEPEYAPFCKKIKGAYRWIPSKRYRDRGFALKTVALPAGDDRDQRLERAYKCRELTRELLLWWDGETKGKTPGTWGFVISRYKSDSFSSITEVAADTRQKYQQWMTTIENAIGEVRILDTDVAMLHEWKGNMIANGRSTSFIHKWFTHFGLVVSHGIKIQEPGCSTVKAIRSEMRIKQPAPRSSFATLSDIQAVVAEADKRNQPWLALAVLFRFEFMLRGVDVYGKWEPAEGRTAGIIRSGKIWTSGLTWDMFERDLSAFTKVINKTADSLSEPYTFDLTLLPDIRRRLMACRRADGPVIVNSSGIPPANYLISRQFKAIVRDREDLSSDLRIADARSGGSTEARDLVDGFTLRDAMQHTQITTTDRYVRGRSARANQVVAARAAMRVSQSD